MSQRQENFPLLPSYFTGKYKKDLQNSLKRKKQAKNAVYHAVVGNYTGERQH